MTDQEQKVWDLVHNWCDQQANPIPDQNRRVLMDLIMQLVEKPRKNKPTDHVFMPKLGCSEVDECFLCGKPEEGHLPPPKQHKFIPNHLDYLNGPKCLLCNEEHSHPNHISF